MTGNSYTKYFGILFEKFCTKNYGNSSSCSEKISGTFLMWTRCSGLCVRSQKCLGLGLELGLRPEIHGLSLEKILSSLGFGLGLVSDLKSELLVLDRRSRLHPWFTQIREVARPNSDLCVCIVKM